MDLMPNHLHVLVQQEGASEELAELYKQAEHVAMLRVPYKLPSGQSFSPFRKNLFGNLTRHLVVNKGSWVGSISFGAFFAIIAILLMPLPPIPENPPLLTSIAIMVSFLLFFMMLTALFAPFVFIVATLYKFGLAYGRGALKALKAPTAICLAPLSIKFVWVQGFGFFRPRVHGWERTVGWEEILGIDCQDGADALPLILITARLMHRNEIFPVHLAGLPDPTDRQAFLRAIDAHVAPEKKSSAFKELLSARELPQLLLSKPNATFEESDPVAQLFLSSEEPSAN